MESFRAFSEELREERELQQLGGIFQNAWTPRIHILLLLREQDVKAKQAGTAAT